MNFGKVPPVERDKFYVCCMATRPGVQLFCTKLEYTHYPPRTPKNDLFNMNIVQWEGLVFYVLEVPLADKNKCETIANSVGMRIADGTPTLLGGGKTLHFPMQGSNVWSLEGAFNGDEQKEVQRILDGDKDKMLSDFQAKTEIHIGAPAELDRFINESIEFHSFSPMMAILFGGDRRACVDTCFFAYIQGRAFSVCTISDKGEQGKGQPAIVGLYVIPKARNLGIGTRLFKAALEYCIATKLTPVRVDVMSDAVMKMIEKLPPDMEQHLVVNLRKFDLTSLEQPYVDNKDWFMDQEK